MNDEQTTAAIYQLLVDQLEKAKSDRSRLLDFVCAIWPQNEPMPDWLKALMYRGTHVVMADGTMIPAKAYNEMREELGRRLGYVD